MSKRREQKDERREERERAERESAAAARRKRRFGYLAAAVLVLATIVVVAVVIASGDGAPDPPRPTVASLEQAVEAAGCTLQQFPVEGRGHTTEQVTYKTNPPTSGDHDPQAALDGSYDTSPTKEALVHSLEHGRVVLQYAPDAPAKVKDAVRAVWEEDRRQALVTPNNTDMTYQVAATAWTRVLGCPKYNERVPDALRTFRDSFRGQGPENVP
jgi:hypothetical protein